MKTKTNLCVAFVCIVMAGCSEGGEPAAAQTQELFADDTATLNLDRFVDELREERRRVERHPRRRSSR